MEAANPTHTVLTFGLTSRIVSKTAIPVQAIAMLIAW